MKTPYVRPGLYRHFKNKTVYEVVFTGRNSETMEWQVAYRAPNGEVWFRPYENFISKARLADGTEVTRFEYLDSDW